MGSNIRRKSLSNETVSGAIVIQLIVEPSFENYRSIEILKRFSESGLIYFCRYSILSMRAAISPYRDMMQDGKWIYAEELTDLRETQGFQVGQSLIDNLLGKLSQLTVKPYVSNDKHGFDGTFYHLRFGFLFESVRFAWWEDLPLEWQDLAQIVQTLLDLAQDQH
jgi:hypothetical protein